MGKTKLGPAIAVSNYAEHKKVLQGLMEFESQITNMVTDMGNVAYNHTMQSFRNQGFTDENLERWKPRKRNKDKRDSNRWLLIGRGSGTSGLRGSYRKVRRSLLSISIFNDKVYASVHNEGLRAGRGRGFKMPKRQMIGHSAVMSKRIETRINTRIKRIYNG